MRNTILCLGLNGLASAEVDRPNIVIILADDLGYADLGCQGMVDIGTPYIDSIAANGVRFTDAFGREAVGFIEKNHAKPFLLYLAFNAVHTPLQATDEYEERFPDIEDEKRRTYAGMLSAMDDAVGDVLEKLEEHHLTENTLIFFYSDNGGPTRQTTSSNDPLRGYKNQVYEGGIRIPFLLQWKGKVPAGVVTEEMAMGFDVHATALAAAGVKLPESTKLDGVDLLPFLTGETSDSPHDRLFWRSGKSYAARIGNFKLVRQGDGEPMLIDLAYDIGEEHDLAAEQPGKYAELKAAYEAWAKQMMDPKWENQDTRRRR